MWCSKKNGPLKPEKNWKRNIRLIIRCSSPLSFNRRWRYSELLCRDDLFWKKNKMMANVAARGACHRDHEGRLHHLTHLPEQNKSLINWSYEEPSMSAKQRGIFIHGMVWVNPKEQIQLSYMPLSCLSTLCCSNTEQVLRSELAQLPQRRFLIVTFCAWKENNRGTERKTFSSFIPKW